MGMAAGGKQGVKSDINVTPLVDVVLVLLIIFMVVTPMLQRGKGVKLPAAKQQKENKDKPDPIIVSITPDKRVYVEQDEYPSMDDLQRRLTSDLANHPEKPLLLKGDMSLTFGEVRKVMNVARMAHARGIELAIEEIKEGAAQ